MSISTATQTVITAIARTTTACELHGSIVDVSTSNDGRVFDRGTFLPAKIYRATFADGVARSYWMRGGKLFEVRL